MPPREAGGSTVRSSNRGSSVAAPPWDTPPSAPVTLNENPFSIPAAFWTDTWTPFAPGPNTRSPLTTADVAEIVATSA